MLIHVKRVYEKTEESDGARILVDRLWPRGLSREKANIHYWAKNIAPSTDLRKWYNHDPAKWEEFINRYSSELNKNPDVISEFRTYIQNTDVVTLLFSSREMKLNNAVALKEYFDQSTR